MSTRKLSFLKPTVIIAIITLHSFLMNGYFFQSRQLPVGTYVTTILSKVDLSLFQNSIFIQAVERNNLRISIFFEAIPFLLKYFDFETFAITQTFISLFFVLAGIFALSKVLFGSTAIGYIAALLYSVQLNSWTLGSPAPYLNFFHYGLQYAYPLILWSMVFFFRKRYLASLFLAGISWTFHPMCTLFLLFAYSIYYLFHRREIKFSLIVKSFCMFILPAFPGMIRTFAQLGSDRSFGPLWFDGSWTASFTCYPSSWPPGLILQSVLFFCLAALSIFQIKDRALKNRITPFLLAVLLLCITGTIFADIYPVPLIIKMSLWRSTVIYLFLSIACISMIVCRLLESGSVSRQLLAILVCITLTGYLKFIHPYLLLGLISIILYDLYESHIPAKLKFLREQLLPLILIPLCIFSGYQFLCKSQPPKLFFLAFLVIIFLTIAKRLSNYFHFRTAFLISLVFVFLFDAVVLYSKGGPYIYYNGRVQNKVDPWADIQKFSQKISHKDDLFIVPPHLNDFYIYSQRAVLGDWAEGTYIIYLDEQFAKEWITRMKDLGWNGLWNNVSKSKTAYNKLAAGKICSIAKKYNAKYIISEKPKYFQLPQIYENEKYILYKIFYEE